MHDGLDEKNGLRFICDLQEATAAAGETSLFVSSHICIVPFCRRLVRLGFYFGVAWRHMMRARLRPKADPEPQTAKEQGGERPWPWQDPV